MGENSRADKSERHLGLLFRVPGFIGFLILLFFLLGPYILIVTHPPWGCLLSAAVLPIYLKIRYPSRGFGPMWLSIFDFGIIFGNGIMAVIGVGIMVAFYLS